MNPGRGGGRLKPQQLIQSRALVAIAEPGLDHTIDRERNRHRHEEHEQVLLEEAAKTLPDHVRTPRSASDKQDRVDELGSREWSRGPSSRAEPCLTSAVGVDRFLLLGIWESERN